MDSRLPPGSSRVLEASRWDEPYLEAITNDFVADLDDMEEAETFIDLLDKRQEFGAE